MGEEEQEFKEEREERYSRLREWRRRYKGREIFGMEKRMKRSRRCEDKEERDSGLRELKRRKYAERMKE